MEPELERAGRRTPSWSSLGGSERPEMSFLEQSDSLPLLSPAGTHSSGRLRGKRGTKASRWTRQEAVEEGEPPDLGAGSHGCPEITATADGNVPWDGVTVLSPSRQQVQGQGQLLSPLGWRPHSQGPRPWPRLLPWPGWARHPRGGPSTPPAVQPGPRAPARMTRSWPWRTPGPASARARGRRGALPHPRRPRRAAWAGRTSCRSRGPRSTCTSCRSTPATTPWPPAPSWSSLTPRWRSRKPSLPWWPMVCGQRLCGTARSRALWGCSPSPTSSWCCTGTTGRPWSRSMRSRSTRSRRGGRSTSKAASSPWSPSLLMTACSKPCTPSSRTGSTACPFWTRPPARCFTSSRTSGCSSSCTFLAPCCRGPPSSDALSRIWASAHSGIWPWCWKRRPS